jgi:hypothetical protein
VLGQPSSRRDHDDDRATHPSSVSSPALQQ